MWCPCHPGDTLSPTTRNNLIDRFFSFKKLANADCMRVRLWSWALRWSVCTCFFSVLTLFCCFMQLRLRLECMMFWRCTFCYLIDAFVCIFCAIYVFYFFISVFLCVSKLWSCRFWRLVYLGILAVCMLGLDVYNCVGTELVSACLGLFLKHFWRICNVV